MSEFLLEAAREALLGAQERGADLERALDRERTARLQAEERVAELEAENKRLSDRQEHDFSNNVRLIDQVAALRDRVTELEADEFRLDEDNCCDGNEENCDGCHYCAKRRTQLLFAAQGRVAELERLIDEHEFAAEEQRNGFGGATYAVCPECRVARQSRLPGNHTGDCPWGQAAANHRARQPVEGRDYE